MPLKSVKFENLKMVQKLIGIMFLCLTFKGNLGKRYFLPIFFVVASLMHVNMIIICVQASVCMCVSVSVSVCACKCVF